MFSLDQAEENEVLAPEPRQRRNSGKGQHENQHQDGCDRGTRIQTVKIVEIVACDIAMAQRSNHREGAQVHEGVNEQINQDALDPVGVQLDLVRDARGDEIRRREANPQRPESDGRERSDPRNSGDRDTPLLPRT